MDNSLLGYKKLVVWQKADELAKEIYFITRDFPKEEQFGIISQLRRAALSIPTNIVEGYARQSEKSFKQFLIISYSSLVETEYLLEFSKSLGYIKRKEYENIADLIKEVGKLLWVFSKKIKSKFK